VVVITLAAVELGLLDQDLGTFIEAFLEHLWSGHWTNAFLAIVQLKYRPNTENLAASSTKILLKILIRKIYLNIIKLNI